MVKNLTDSLLAAEQSWKTAEHILKVTFPNVQDPKLLIRALEQLDKTTRAIISSSLKLEYIREKIKLSKKPSENMQSFFDVVAKDYGLSEQDIKNIKEILRLGHKHKESDFEFSYKKTFVLLDDGLQQTEIKQSLLEELSVSTRNFLTIYREQLQKS